MGSMFQDIAPRPRQGPPPPLNRWKTTPARPVPRPPSTQQASTNQTAPLKRPQPRAKKQRSSVKSYAATIALAVLLGLLAQFQGVGLVIIAAYSVAAIIWRVSSRKTFLLALLSLAVAAVALMVNRWLIARNFAAYSFFLFVSGAIVLCIEQRNLSKLLHKKHQTLQTDQQDANVKKPFKTVV